jgi:hypothetical protein
MISHAPEAAKSAAMAEETGLQELLHAMIECGRATGVVVGKRRRCDRCGKAIRKKDLRYVVKIQVYAAADPLEITAAELAADHDAEIRRLLRQCERMSAEELMRDVYVALEFSLCSPCRKVYLSNPLQA